MWNDTRSFELNILVGGRPISEYEHEGHLFVEGRKGSDFEVEFKNKTAGRVLLVPSVDGKSVLDGQPATPDSMGYIVPAWGSVKIPGWTLNGNEVAKFTFDDKDKSYASRTTVGSAIQSGVIGVLVYEEKQAPKPVEHHYHHWHNQKLRSHYPPYDPSIIGLEPTWAQSGLATQNNDPLRSRGMTSSSKGTLSIDPAIATAMNAVADNAIAEPQSASHENTSSTPFEMGTAFGERMDFKVSQKTFDRGDLKAQMVIYYDSRRNLEKRGIVLVKREQRYLSDLPEAFSGLGCKPPADWKG